MFRKRKRKKRKIRIKYLFIDTLCIGLFILGFLNITNGFPQFIKDKSSFSLNYSFKPLDIKIKTGDYVVYFNKSILTSGENNVHNILGNIEGEVFKIVNLVNHKK
jgi:hypothetical protein